jgi:glycosyltransferase involved in cell wall biosynthesis
MKTSIILLRCDFNQDLFELTKAAVQTLKGADQNILIDNGSTVGDIKDWADIYVKNKVNKGYTGGVNQGIKLATGDIIFLINNDILVSSNMIEVTKDIFNKNLGVGSVHFRMQPYDEPFFLGMDTWVDGKERWCHASCFAIRRDAIPAGAWDESFGEGGYDDYAVFHIMRDLEKWQQAYTNRVAFRHKDSSTYMALDKRDGGRTERDMKNRELYKQRFGEYPDVQFAKLFPEQMTEPWRPFP